MEYGAIDLHSGAARFASSRGRTVVLERRIETTREALTRVFGGPAAHADAGREQNGE